MTDLEKMAREAWEAADSPTISWEQVEPLFLDLARRAHAEGFKEGVERAVSLHENVDPACAHEIQRGDPGAGAIGAVVRYREAIRSLLTEPGGEGRT